jgi:hypothetical protein
MTAKELYDWALTMPSHAVIQVYDSGTESWTDLAPHDTRALVMWRPPEMPILKAHD